MTLEMVGRMMRLDGLALCEVPYHPEIVMGWLLEDLDTLAAIEEKCDKPWLGDDPDHVEWLDEVCGNSTGVWI